MKILTLRLKNINSLAGEHEINFTTPDFTNDGLFAITGKTGSGKSSILDAISLALYGRTPRVEISNSHNAVMTKGENDCYAEIQFTINDKNWSSKFSQRRTVTGNLTSVVRQIADADGTIVAEGVNECNERIEPLIGLNFKQFTKVIMLAQGSFAAFLQADKNDKGELLEQITGTEIYGEISKLVHRRAADEKIKLEGIANRLEAIRVLSNEQIAEINTEIAALGEEDIRLAELLKNLQDCKNWLAKIEELTKSINSEKDRLPELKSNAKGKISAYDNVAEKLKSAEEELKKFEPVFRETRTLDTRISEINKIIAPLKKDMAILENEKNKLSADLKSREDQLNLEQDALAQKNLWISEHTNYENLLSEYEVIARDNKTAQKFIQELENLKNEIQSLAETIDKKEKVVKKLNKDFDKLDQELSSKNNEKFTNDQELNQLLNGKVLGDIRVKKDSLLSLIGKIEMLMKVWDDLKTNDKVIGTLNQKKENNISERLTWAKRKPVIEKSLEQLNEQITLLEENIQLNRAIQSLEDHRKLLKDGEACPLCGALDHPYAVGNIPQIGEKEGQLSELRLKYKTEEDELQTIKNHLLRIDTENKGIDQQLNSETASLNRNKEQEERLRNEIKELDPQFMFSGDGNKADQLEKTLTQYKNEKNHLVDLINKAEELENKIKKIKDDLASLTDKKAKLSTEKLSVEKDIESTDQKKKERVCLLEKKQEEHSRLDEILSEKFRFYNVKGIEQLEECHDQWIANIARVTQLKEIVKGLEKDISLIRKDVDHKSELWQQKNSELDEKHKLLTELQEKRFILFGNQSVDSEEQELKASINDYKKQTNLAQEEKMTAQRELDAAHAVIKEKESELENQLNLRKTDRKAEDIDSDFNSAKDRAKEVAQHIGSKNKELELNSQSLVLHAKKLEEKKAQEGVCRKWDSLDDLIGSADGKTYRNFAQALTFEHLVALANQQLQKMSDRYLLNRTGDPQKNPFDLSVIDKFQNEEERTTQNLSGGEKFIISLSLALGLANMAGNNIRIDTMFIDEGFGTLDADYLDVALTTLSNLQQEGKLIGVISHITELKERIGTHIEVIQRGNGHSRIQVSTWSNEKFAAG